MGRVVRSVVIAAAVADVAAVVARDRYAAAAAAGVYIVAVQAGSAQGRWTAWRDGSGEVVGWRDRTDWRRDREEVGADCEGRVELMSRFEMLEVVAWSPTLLGSCRTGGRAQVVLRFAVLDLHRVTGVVDAFVDLVRMLVRERIGRLLSRH